MVGSLASMDWRFWLTVLAIGGVALWMIMSSAFDGSMVLSPILVAIGVWIAGPILYIIVRGLFQQQNAVQYVFSHWSTQTWTTMLGNTIFVPIGLAVLTLGHSRVWWRGDWWCGKVWTISSIVLGCLLTAAWSVFLDYPWYKRYGATWIYWHDSSRIAHGFVTAPIIATALIYIAVPMAVNARHTWKFLLPATVIMVGGFLFAQMHDASKVTPQTVYPTHLAQTAGSRPLAPAAEHPH